MMNIVEGRGHGGGRRCSLFETRRDGGDRRAADHRLHLRRGRGIGVGLIEEPFILQDENTKWE